MRILQLTSDWKWTGPAEPMLRLGLALRERGSVVWLGCPDAPDGADRSLGSEAAKAGISPSIRLRPGRGVEPLGDRAEVARLRDFLERERIDIVHTWHTRDHVLAARAARARRRRGLTRVVRSYRIAERISRAPWSRWLYGRATDGLLCVSPGTARRNAGLCPGPVRGAFGAVDLDRFQPEPRRDEDRIALGLRPSNRVVGIVARVQAHRRFDLLLEAARRLFDADPDARLLVVGRGTHRRALAEEPAARLGIADRVVFAGYRNEDYARVLRTIDCFTFLVPGSDGTCRALLEAAACGIPAVTSRRGALPEIVVDGVTGLLADEEPQALADAWQEVLGDAGRRRSLGDAARARAESHFSPSRMADAVESLYQDLPRGPRG